MEEKQVKLEAEITKEDCRVYPVDLYTLDSMVVSFKRMRFGLVIVQKQCNSSGQLCPQFYVQRTQEPNFYQPCEESFWMWNF